MAQFYDGTKLLSLKDINGDTPEIYACTTNRSGGKTTWFNRYCVKKFLAGEGKFGLIYRFNYELDNVADKFFKDIGGLFFPDYTMRSERKANGLYHELFLVNKEDTSKNGGVSCGYAITLNSADQLKKCSHFFSDIQRMVFDEFQSETNHYCSGEIIKLMSIHKSVARGGGLQRRYVPVYMISNPVSIINPYYVEWGVSSRLREDTKFIRGNGFVLEQGFVQGAADTQNMYGFEKAFGANQYNMYSAQGVYLNDNKAFIEKPNGKSRYLCTFKYKNSNFAIREFAEEGIIYCDDKADMSFPYKLSVTTEDHNVNYVMLKRNEMFLVNLRFYFDHGCFRFKDLRCKEAVLKALSY